MTRSRAFYCSRLRELVASVMYRSTGKENNDLVEQ